MMRLLLNIAGHSAGVAAPAGLPAGSVHVPDARLILASTVCTLPLFQEQMLAAAQATESDVLLMRHGLFPEQLEPTMCDLVLYLNGCPAFIRDMLLYHHPEDGFWLVPAGVGPHVAIERLAKERGLATVIAMHVPSRAGVEHGMPHVHAIAFARSIKDGPLGFGAFTSPELCRDSGREIIEAEWRAWRAEHERGSEKAPAQKSKSSVEAVTHPPGGPRRSSTTSRRKSRR